MDIMTYILIAIIILVVIFAKMALVIIPQSESRLSYSITDATCIPLPSTSANRSMTSPSRT